MHALSSCVWSGEEKKKIKKKLRCIVDYDYWPNGCVDLVNSRTSIRYALENSSCAIILLRSFTSRLLEFLVLLFIILGDSLKENQLPRAFSFL